MRILHVISRMNFGGTATYLNNLVFVLLRNEQETKLVIGEVAPGEIEDPDIDSKLVIRIKSMARPINLWQDLLSAWRLRRIINKYQPDIVHTHAFKAGFLGRIIAPKKVGMVHTLHGHHIYDSEFRGWRNKLLIFIERKLALRSDALISVGEKVKKELIDSGLKVEVPFVSIAPGIEVPRLLDRDFALQKLGMDKGEVKGCCVLWMGRFVEVKRPELLIEIARRFPDDHFLMAGDGPLRKKFECEAPKNVKFLGWQPRDTLLSVADVLVSTSESEGMPLGLIEAQMSGIPVIAPNVGSISEVIIDHNTGFLVSSDMTEVDEKLKLLLQSKQRRDMFSENAYRHSIRNFSLDKLLKNHMEVYREVLSRNV